MPDDTTAPVTAEGLRERIEAALRSTWDGQPTHMDDAIRVETDAVLAALAGDPGDLPARMAEAIGEALNQWSRPDAEGTRGVRRWDFVAAAAMSVRWEDHVRTEAENERLRAAKRHLSERISTGQEGWNEISRERDRLEREVERLRAELTEARAAAEQSAAEGNQDLARFNQYREWTHEVVAERDALKAELAEIKKVTDTPADEEMPTDPAELREMWQFINRQARWQWHMAHKFGAEVERLRAELAEERAKTAEWRRVHDAHEELHDLGESAIGKWRQRAEQAEAERDALKAAIERVERLRDKWLTYPQDDMHYAAGLMLDRHLSGKAFALDAPETPGDAETGQGWRERARARVGDRVATRMAELDDEPPLSAEEFDEAMARNKAEAKADLHRQSVETFGEPDGDTDGEA